MGNKAKDNWYKRYCQEVNNRTFYYEMLNKESETKVHKATPEETEKYMAMTRKPKPYLTLRGV